ncbi:MAG: DUF411 domain-containing protein [Chloroflexota bacterium]
MKQIAVLALAIAGIIHLYISPNHYSHAPAHGIFFALSGTAQVVWAIAAFVRTNRTIYYTGVALSGGLVVLWLLTQVWTPPFSEMAEPVDIWMILSKAAEVIAFFALVFFMNTWTDQDGEEQDEPKLGRNIAGGLVTAAVAGLIFYGGGYAAEPMLPALQHATGGAHDDSDGHHADDEDDHDDSDDHHADGEDAHADVEDGHDDSDGHHADDEDAHADDNRQQEVAEAGAMVMPFDLEKTIHVFETMDNGGLQQVVAKDAEDSEQIELIRSHLSEEADRFASGDFSDPARIHGEDMPGLTALAAGADQVNIEYSELSDGAQIVYASDDADLVEAIHLWFKAQLADHGDHATDHADGDGHAKDEDHTEDGHAEDSNHEGEDASEHHDDGDQGAVDDPTVHTVTVYKSPTCGCCQKWVEHMEEAGFTVEAHDMDDMTVVKDEQDVPSNLHSCHTAVVDGYVIEGHVPAESVAQLLTKRPNISGLAVPGMPIGSPGMEVEGYDAHPYDVVAYDEAGLSGIFASYR